MSQICSYSITTLGDLLDLLQKANPKDSFQWTQFITKEGVLIMTTNQSPDEENSTFEEMIDYTEDYIEEFGNSHQLKICDVNYNRDNIYIDITSSYLRQLCDHIIRYEDDIIDMNQQIQLLRNQKYDTIGQILDLLLKAKNYDKYAYIENGICVPDDPIIDSENNFYFIFESMSISYIIDDIKFVHSDTMDSSPFKIYDDYSEKKKTHFINELIDIIQTGMMEEYEEMFEPEPYITLDYLRNILSNSSNRICEYGFRNPHSYRENYYEVGFEPCSDVSICEMKYCVERALSDSFRGYHGGDFTFSRNTRAHISNEGCGEIPQMMRKVIRCIRNL